MAHILYCKCEEGQYIRNERKHDIIMSAIGGDGSHGQKTLLYNIFDVEKQRVFW